MSHTAAGRSPATSVLRTFLVPILAVAVLTSATAVWALASRAPDYVSTGSVLVDFTARENTVAVVPQMGTERAIALSAVVADRAAAELGVAAEAVTEQLDVTVPVDTQVLDFAYTAADDVEAQEGAEASIEAYVEYRNEGLDDPVARVITEPALPDEPTPPSYSVAVLLALVAGLGLGYVAAYTWDRLRGRVRGPADAARVTGAEVLVSVPARARVEAPLEHGPGGFSHLAARLSNLLGNRRRNVAVMVTGPRRGAGATTVAANLAVALAQVGKDVVLVSGDSRRPDLHRVLGLERSPGVTEVLHGDHSLVSAVQFTAHANLRVLTAGASSATVSAEDVEDFLAIVKRLASDAIVVIDAAPVLEEPATLLVGNACELTILAVDVRAGSDRQDAALAAESLRRLPGRLVGIVATRPRASRRVEPPAEPVRTPTERADAVLEEQVTTKVSDRGSARNPW
jgi:Mrp family chromosome partitioning ATPase